MTADFDSPESHESRASQDRRAETENDAHHANKGTLPSDEAKNRPEINNPFFASDAQPSAASKQRKLPSWLDHFNAKDLIKLFKCSLAVWIMTVLIFINPTLTVLGPTAFVGCIVLVIIPPTGVIFFQLIASVMILIGLGLGWAWGVLVMKAALATRPASVVQEKYRSLEEMAKNATNPSEYMEDQLLSGYMLDTRVSITYYCLIGLFLYLTARLRISFPKLMPISMFSCIICIVWLTEAPLMPTFDGTLPKILIIPIAVAAGLGLVCNLFIFPTSSSSELVDGIKSLLSPMPVFLDACSIYFDNPQLRMSMEKLMNAKLGTINAHKSLDGALLFMSMDVSLSRWSPEDLIVIYGALRPLVASFVGLIELRRVTEEHSDRDTEALTVVEGIDSRTADEPPAKNTGQHQITRRGDFRINTNHPDRDRLMAQSLQAFSKSSTGLMNSMRAGIAAINEAVAASNIFAKSLDHADMLERHKDILNKLKAHRSEFVNSTSQGLLEAHRHLFKADGSLNTDGDRFPPLNGLLLGLLFEDKLLQISDALDGLLGQVIWLETNRKQMRLWLPKMFRSKAASPTLPDDISPRQPDSSKQNTKPADSDKSGGQGFPAPRSAKSQLQSMRTANNRQRGKAGQVILFIVRWFSSTESIFAFRLLIVTIALSVPAVIKRSSGFFYREKGLWAVIMAQLALTPYTADLVYGIIVRSIGTIIGGVVGMVAWYIGAGSGDGNPYGMAAIMAVVIIVLFWIRLFAPPIITPASIMMAATAYLVDCYGWIDVHMPSYGSPGVGYNLLWRRIVLVFVGFAGATIVNFLPRPPSANSDYRRMLAESIASSRDRYALLVSNCSEPASDLRQVAEEDALTVAESLFSIMGPIKLTSFEFSTSNFDANALGRICHLCTILNQTVTQLIQSMDELPPEHRDYIINSTGATNDDLIEELMAILSLTQLTLKSSDPLPAVLPTPLFSKLIGRARQNISQGSSVEGLFIRDGLDSLRLRRYVAFLNALGQFLGAVDELVLVLKESVGETSDMALVQTV